MIKNGRKEKQSNLIIHQIWKRDKQKGITLIALVVTIIVLLILASISMTLFLGDDGILARAKNSTELYKQAEENEQIQLNNLYSELASATSSGINIEEISSLIEQIVDTKTATYKEEIEDLKSKVNKLTEESTLTELELIYKQTSRTLTEETTIIDYTKYKKIMVISSLAGWVYVDNLILTQDEIKFMCFDNSLTLCCTENIRSSAQGTGYAICKLYASGDDLIARIETSSTYSPSTSATAYVNIYGIN